MNRRMSILEKIPLTRSRVICDICVHAEVRCAIRDYKGWTVATGRAPPRYWPVVSRHSPRNAGNLERVLQTPTYRVPSPKLGVHYQLFPHYRSAFHHRKLRPNRNRKRNREFTLTFAGSISFLREKEKERKEDSLRNRCLVSRECLVALEQIKLYVCTRMDL